MLDCFFKKGKGQFCPDPWYLVSCLAIVISHYIWPWFSYNLYSLWDKGLSNTPPPQKKKKNCGISSFLLNKNIKIARHACGIDYMTILASIRVNIYFLRST